MAENKKSFILYADLITVVEKLIIKDRENKTNYSGELFFHILQYVNDKNPIATDFIIDMAFEPIKLQLKRDLKRYETIREKRSDAGKKSAEIKAQQMLTSVESKKQKSTKSTSVESVEQNKQVLTHVNKRQQRSTNSTVTVNDTVNVTVNDNEIKEGRKEEEKPSIQQPILISENDLNKILPDQIVKIETAIGILKSPRCQSWRDFIGMQQSIKADDMFVLFDKFEIHCKEQNNFEKTYKDAQNHFGHWIKKGLHNPKPQTENLNQSRSDIFDKNSKPQTPGDWVWFEKTSRWVDKKVLPKHMLRQVENN